MCILTALLCRHQDDRRAIDAARVRAEPHPSQAAVAASAVAATGGVLRGPVELAELDEQQMQQQVDKPLDRELPATQAMLMERAAL